MFALCLFNLVRSDSTTISSTGDYNYYLSSYDDYTIYLGIGCYIVIHNPTHFTITSTVGPLNSTYPGAYFLVAGYVTVSSSSSGRTLYYSVLKTSDIPYDYQCSYIMARMGHQFRWAVGGTSHGDLDLRYSNGQDYCIWFATANRNEYAIYRNDEIESRYDFIAAYTYTGTTRSYEANITYSTSRSIYGSSALFHWHTDNSVTYSDGYLSVTAYLSSTNLDDQISGKIFFYNTTGGKVLYLDSSNPVSADVGSIIASIIGSIISLIIFIVIIRVCCCHHKDHDSSSSSSSSSRIRAPRPQYGQPSPVPQPYIQPQPYNPNPQPYNPNPQPYNPSPQPYNPAPQPFNPQFNQPQYGTPYMAPTGMEPQYGMPSYPQPDPYAQPPPILYQDEKYDVKV